MKIQFFKRASLLALLILVTGFSFYSSSFSNHSITYSDNAYHSDLCSGFLPDNDLSYPIGSTFNGAPSGLTREQFDSVLDKIDAIYIPIVKAMGGTFRLFRDWENPLLTAKAGRGRAEIDIMIYGGVARHPSMTEDGLALVACHEVGHHFGGFPRLTHRMLAWMTIEGQADYFASFKCLRLYFDEASNAAWFKANASSVPAVVAEKCGNVYASPAMTGQVNGRNIFSARDSERISCMRSTMAGLAVGGLFKEVNKDTVLPSVETPDTRAVSKTYTGHPASQCRIDTYFQGALCDMPVNDPISNTDYRVGICADANRLGTRPTCWFRAN